MGAESLEQHALAGADLQDTGIGPAVGDHGGQQAMVVTLVRAGQAIVDAVAVLAVPLLDRGRDDGLVALAHEQLADPRPVERDHFHEPPPAQIGHASPRISSIPG